MDTETRAVDESSSGSQESKKKSYPQEFGKYTLQKKLGEGGMGSVYLALDKEIDREVALKVLPKDKAANDIMVARFKSEADAAANLLHHNIVSVYETGEYRGYLYISLEYIRGIDVLELVKQRGTVDIKRSLDIITQVTKALEHAHEQRIVHRDIKPSNLMIQRDGTVKLADMGLARVVDETEEAGITKDGTTVGTVDYMSPEQARSSKSADIRSDIYSLGCSWYHMLAGQAPFHRGSLINRLHGHATAARPDPRAINQDVPEPIVEVMHRMMARKVKDRYQDPTELVNDLEAINLDTGDSATLDDGVESYIEEEFANEDEFDYGEFDGTAAETNDHEATEAIPSKKSKPKKATKKTPINPLWIGAGVVAIIAVAIVIIASSGGGISDDNQIADNGTDTTDVETNGNGNGTETNEDNPPDSVVDPVDPPPNDPPNSPDNGTDTKPANNTPPAASREFKLASRDETRLLLPPTSFIGREGEKEYLPEWLTKSASPAGLQTLEVNRRRSLKSQYISIGNALSNLPNEGAIIEIKGSGPYLVYPQQIKDANTVAIRGVGGARPLVLLMPDPNESNDTILDFTGTALTLQNLDIVAFANQFSAATTWFSLHEGDLAVGGCSFTIVGSSSSPMTLFRMDSDAEDGSQVLFDRTVVKGNNVRVLNCELASLDLTIANSCVLSEAGTVVGCHFPSSSAGDVLSSRRSIRVLSSSIATNGAVLQFSLPKGFKQAPQTQIASVNSVVSTIDKQSGSRLVNLVDWPRVRLRSNGESGFQNLEWLTVASAYGGWPTLVRSGGRNIIDAADSWWSIWQVQTKLNDAFTQASWNQPEGSISEWKRQDFDSASFPDLAVQGTDNNVPGAAIGVLKDLDSTSVQRLQALFQRPELAAYKSIKPTATVEVDLTKEDLGRRIQNTDWEDGTRFVCTGAGVVSFSAFHVKGKSLQIEFKPEGKDVIVQPTISFANQTDDVALMSIEDGTIEIINGKFQLKSTTRHVVSNWFLKVHNGSFRIHNTRVVGSLLPGDQFQGLVRWTRGMTRNSIDEQDRQYGIVTNCFMASTGPLMNAEVRGRDLVIQNSSLMSLSTLLDLNLISIDREIRAAVNVSHSTLSARESIFNIRSKKLVRASQWPLRVFSTESVYAAPSNAKPSELTLLRCNKAVTAKGQVDWRGYRNVFGNRINFLIRDEGETASRVEKSIESWTKHWGSDRSTEPLFDGNALLPNADVTLRGELDTDHFQLNNSSEARSWAEGGLPAGFDFNSWGF